MKPGPQDAQPGAVSCAVRLRVRGVVQGVGFRPYVYRLAQALNLAGWVRNDEQGVEIALQGAADAIEALIEQLPRAAPPLARIDEIRRHVAPLAADLSAGFVILESGHHGLVSTLIGPDVATCPACLAELFDPADRRWRYPFINCTHCGPRYTLTARLPYDRANTSMAAFPLCADCAAEYADPADRRFHAEPTACPRCGPQLAVLDAAGRPLAVEDPLAETLRRIAAGEIVALKGLGGFHLLCDARQPDSVARLRARKARGGKPFALMVANPASLLRWAAPTEAEQACLQSAEGPVVLLKKGEYFDALFPGVAPGLGEVGVLLPYTPLHHLLFHEAAGRPAGTAWLDDAQPLVLVCTSANPGGEPLVIDNREAIRRLAGIADVFVVHDREILIRCDDSVLRVDRDGPRLVRRARGYTPQAIRLAQAAPPVLALGAHLKNTLCVTRDDYAVLSQHIGDLDNAASCVALEQAVEHLLQLMQVRPAAIAHELHPDTYASRLAERLALEFGVPAIAVQHHHAHLAAVLAEHRYEGPALGLALDGFGLGSDGGSWGGELLQLDGGTCQRLGHLAPLPQPGGDAATREPWRMAAAVLHGLGQGEKIEERFADCAGVAGVRRLLERPALCPPTSSLGRVFDAAAALLGVCRYNSYEGEAAMRLEALAGPAEPLPQGWRIEPADGLLGGVLSLVPLWRHLAKSLPFKGRVGVGMGQYDRWETHPPPGLPLEGGEVQAPSRDETSRARSFGASVFHATLVAALVDWAVRAARRQRVTTIALGGGCMLNRRLSSGLVRGLRAAGLRVLEARQLPPSDGGLALGQAQVARLRLLEGER